MLNFTGKVNESDTLPLGVTIEKPSQAISSPATQHSTKPKKREIIDL